ncbi:MAG: helix-turn-helix transcriptional regulator, partial [Actinobacteria bacterium]|nr:helix-turn-helix transcriptional regulator [Actinomycetota bacterium]
MEPDARREQILECATELFGERPYAAVSTGEIAREAGVARGLLNHYFGTKRDLYLEVVRRMVLLPELPDFGDAGIARRPLRDRVARSVD